MLINIWGKRLLLFMTERPILGIHFSREFLFGHTFKIYYLRLSQKNTTDSPKLQKRKKCILKLSSDLTKFKMCYSPVVVQFGLQFFLIAVHFNSFGVKMNSIDEISFPKRLITLIPTNISCGCREKTKSHLFQSLLVECISRAHAKTWRFKNKCKRVHSFDYIFIVNESVNKIKMFQS